MKNRILYITLVSLIITLGSCTDVLNQDPLDKISENDVWLDESLVRAYVTDFYTRFQFKFREVSCHGCSGWLNYTDEGTVKVTSSNQNTITTGGMSHTNESQGYWDYSYVRDLNVFLEKIEDTSFNEEVKAQLEGEVRTIRAVVYLEMQKRYGGVPLVDIVLDPFGDIIDELYLRRSTEESIADFIDQELSTSIELLGEDHTETGRINKWTAYAYKARANLWAASIAKYGTVQSNGLVGIPAGRADEFYEKSAVASSSIIESGRYELYNEFTDRSENYRNLFLDDGNVEAIFEQIFDGVTVGHSFSNNSLPPRFSVGFGGVANPLLEFVLGYESIDGSTTQPEFGPENLYEDGIELWANKDPRLRATVFLQGESYAGSTIQSYDGLDPSPQPDPSEIIADARENYQGTPTVGEDGRASASNHRPSTGFSLRKYMNDEPLQAQQTNATNWKEIRLAEMYLILAESEFELGNLDEAAQALNATRERAGISLVDAGNITLEHVRTERRSELAFEGFRWWDLRRWRTAQNVLHRSEPFQGLRVILHYESGNFYFFPFDVESFTRTFRVEHYYNPITQSRIENQAQLEENPGY